MHDFVCKSPAKAWPKPRPVGMPTISFSKGLRLDLRKLHDTQIYTVFSINHYSINYHCINYYNRTLQKIV